MDIHEYQAKQILNANGIKTPKGRIAYTALEAKNVAREISARGPWVLKAQIHSDARNNGYFIEPKAGNKGGIRIVRSLNEVYENALQMLGSTLVTSQTGPKGRLVSRIYVEVYNKPQHSFYLGMALDCTLPAITLLAADSNNGDVADVVTGYPEKILRIPLGVNGPTHTQIGQLISFLKLPNKSQDSLHNFIRGMFKAFINSDALMIEINPAGILKNKEIIALDAKIELDDRALYRHPQYEHFRDDDESESRQLKASQYGFVYNEYDGNIGCIVNGEGLASAMMGIMKDSVACTLNIKGGTDRDKIAAGIKIIATNPKVEGMIINIIGGFVRCDTIADGIIDTAAEVGMNMPLVVRFEGTNNAEGRRILENANFKVIMADNMEDAAAEIIKAVEENE